MHDKQFSERIHHNFFFNNCTLLPKGLKTAQIHIVQKKSLKMVAIPFHK